MEISKRPEKFEETVFTLADILKNRQYAFRGTISLALQETDKDMDDIDIFYNRQIALAYNDLLKDFVIKDASCKESNKFKTYFRRFKMNRISVEAMGKKKRLFLKIKKSL